MVNIFKNQDIISESDRIPESVKGWPDSSWKKYFYKYMIDNKLFFVYPSISYSTNFADIGEHWKSSGSFFQVPLEQSNKTIEVIHFDNSNNKYDAYFEILADCLISFGAEIDTDTCIDIYGTKQYDHIDNKFLLSIKNCPKSLRSFGTELVPLWQNIIQNNNGNIFNYSTKNNFTAKHPSLIRNKILERHQALGYYTATKTKYYKIGYYLLHPLKFLRKRFYRN